MMHAWLPAGWNGKPLVQEASAVSRRRPNSRPCAAPCAASAPGSGLIPSPPEAPSMALTWEGGRSRYSGRRRRTAMISRRIGAWAAKWTVTATRVCSSLNRTQCSEPSHRRRSSSLLHVHTVPIRRPLAGRSSGSSGNNRRTREVASGLRVSFSPLAGSLVQNLRAGCAIVSPPSGATRAVIKAFLPRQRQPHGRRPARRRNPARLRSR